MMINKGYIAPASAPLTLGVAFLCACAASSDARSPKSAAEQATEFSQTRCTGYADDAAIKDILSGAAVEEITPLYNGFVGSKTGPHLEGAVVYVRPSAGETAEWLDRALECHSARRTSAQALGLVAASDPFFLPDSHVTIRVRSAGDSFRVEIEGASVAEANEILARASSFAASQGRVVAGQPELP